jgi:prepilin-type processing-associated H-X9-DG protein
MGVTGARVLPYQVSQTGQSVELSLIPSQVADLPPTPAWPVGLMCPNAPDHRLRAAILWNAQGFNWTTGDWTQSIVLRRDRVDRPADKAQMTDSNDWHVMGQGDLATMHRADYKRFWDRHGDGDWVSGFNGMVAYRHTEGAIILHFDGHVAYYTKQSAWHYLESDPNRPHDDRNANLWDVRP